MKDLVITLKVQVYESVNDLTAEEMKLIEASRQSLEKAYAPYSNFKVGAAVLLSNGLIISGNNQENAAYPSGLCAERVAVYYAMSQFPNEQISAIAISAKKSVGELKSLISPCGSCRQVISEYETNQGKPIKLMMQGEEGKIYCCQSIEGLLPLMFGKPNLI